jgi:hypothetical protein
VNRAGVENGYQAEREALERVLRSGIFDRSPNLASILSYVCRMYFEGRSAEIKEYNVAVEALGRPPEFDKRRDSIVRVEAHRLRKRLERYYAGPGASDPVRIVLREGTYAPEFIHRETSVQGEPTAGQTPTPMEEAAKSWRTTLRSGASLAVGLALAIAAAWAAWRLWPQQTPSAPASSESRVENAGAAAGAPGEEIRILAGRGPGQYIDHYGQVWEGDRFFQGGAAVTTQQIMVRGLDPNLFASKREGDFSYRIPLKPGDYELHLLFAETEYGEGNPLGGSEGYRVFDVFLNGKQILRTFDVISDAGGNNLADMRVFKNVRPGSDGFLQLDFQSSSAGRAFVNAIEILPGINGRLRPIRMVARRQPYKDPQGRIWHPDHFVNAGILIVRPIVPWNYPNPELYRGERYGHFTYSIPVAEGVYGVSFYFNEFWWGPTAPGSGGVGSRIFRVYCNHQLLLDYFDLFREAGGSMKPLIKTFHGLRPNARGKLVFDFEPVVNYALINALEVFDETPASR